MPFVNNPITPAEAYSGDYWRKRSFLTRNRAARLAGAQRERLLRVASEYENLADRADRVWVETHSLEPTPPDVDRQPDLFDTIMQTSHGAAGG